MILKLDLHTHSSHSREAFGSVEEILLAAKSRGMDGIALTDHDSVAGNREAARLAKKHGLIFIPGCEIKSRDGDIIALGIKKIVRLGMSVEKTIGQIHKQGALAVAAHPFALFLHPFGGVGDKVYTCKFDAIEAFNARTYSGNSKALFAADYMKLPKTSGSDAHTPAEVGRAYTIVDCEPNPRTILREIKSGRTEIFGKNSGKRQILNWMARKFAKKRLGMKL